MYRALTRASLSSVVRHHHHYHRQFPSPIQRSAVSSSSSTTSSSSPFWRLFATENKQSSTSDQSNTTQSSSSSPTTDEQTTTTATADAQGNNENHNNTNTLSPEIEQLQKQIEEKDAQIAELNDRALRTFAEMENVRMIARRDVDNTKKFAVVPFAKSILSVADNLGLALGSVEKERVEGENADPLLKGLYIGVQATESELLKVLSQHGISRYGQIGDKFDPNKYQAMFEAPSEEHEPGTVINVQKLGYQLDDRVLRPAEVGVSKAP